MSANRFEHPRFKEIQDMLQTEEGARKLLEQSFEISHKQSKSKLEELLFDYSEANAKKYGTLGWFIAQLKQTANVVGEDVEVFIRDEEGIHVPLICIERTPNELPVDKIITLRTL